MESDEPLLPQLIGETFTTFDPYVKSYINFVHDNVGPLIGDWGMVVFLIMFPTILFIQSGWFRWGLISVFIITMSVIYFFPGTTISSFTLGVWFFMGMLYRYIVNSLTAKNK